MDEQRVAGAKRRDQLRTRLVIHVEYRYLAAAAHEFLARSPPDARSATGHDGYLAFDVHAGPCD